MASRSASSAAWRSCSFFSWRLKLNVARSRGSLGMSRCGFPPFGSPSGSGSGSGAGSSEGVGSGYLLGSESGVGSGSGCCSVAGVGSAAAGVPSGVAPSSSAFMSAIILSYFLDIIVSLLIMKISRPCGPFSCSRIPTAGASRLWRLKTGRWQNPAGASSFSSSRCRARSCGACSAPPS